MNPTKMVVLRNCIVFLLLTLTSGNKNLISHGGNMVDGKGQNGEIAINFDYDVLIDRMLELENAMDSTYHARLIDDKYLGSDSRDWDSKVCLSCHDGVTARASHTTTNVGDIENIEFSMDFNHPVSIDFNSQIARSKSYLNDPSITPSGLGGTIEQDLLVNGKVECSSCHILFLNVSTQKYATLIKSNSGSQLCFTCHNR